jgi:putative CRISPR-associated protein (TIGR02619 family)
MKLLLLSTCGTSLFTNGAPEDVRVWLSRVSNRATLEAEDEARLTTLVRERRRLLHESDDTTQRRYSAELNGIGAVLERCRPSDVHHLLVPSDTAVGRAAASAVAETITARGQKVDQLVAGGLRVDDPASFREAVADLTMQLEGQLPGWQKQGWTVWFNLAGGFKSVNAYLQALGMLYADCCVFLFESSPTLIEIPRLPVRLADLEEVRRHLGVFRRLLAGYPVPEADGAGISASLLLPLDGELGLSVWGDVVWARSRGAVLAECLLEPLSSKLMLRPALHKEFGDLEAERKVQVNERLDKFSAHLDTGRPLLQSATFKKLKGDPKPPSTHELYAWSDGDARRFLGHYEGDRFVIDTLARHL